MGTKGRRWGMNKAEWASPEGQEFSVLQPQLRDQAAPRAVLSSQLPLPSLPSAPVSTSWSWGKTAAAACLETLSPHCAPSPRICLLVRVV